MKQVLVLLLSVSLLLMIFVNGCGKQETTQDDKPPADVQQAEHADTTAMDSGAVEEAPVDTMASQRDSM